MRACLFLATILTWFLGLLAGPVWAALDPTRFNDLAFEQHPGNALPAGIQLTNESGSRRPLSSFFEGKPVIVVLEYLRCPNLCGLVLGGLLDGLSRTPLVSSRDYEVLAVSIDPHETAADAAAARHDYQDRYGADALRGWHFLTGAEGDVRQIADSVGFPYRWDDAIAQYAHPAGAVIATPSGQVSRYLFGVSYEPLDLRLGLVEASEGTIASPAARLLLLCYGYDPKSGSYQPMILRILQAAGAATVALGGVYIVAQLRRDARG